VIVQWKKLISKQLLTVIGTVAFTSHIAAPAFAFDTAPLQRHIEQLEHSDNVRIGVSVLDTGTGETFSYKDDARFPLNSTFKAFACGALLARADQRQIDLSEHRPVTDGDIVPWSPVTEKNLGAPGLTLEDHCRAVLEWSDNTSANVLLDALGGPDALTAILRDLGDTATRIDRYEPAANLRNSDDDPRDTTTPRAALESFKTYVAGDALSEASREKYLSWIKGGQVTGALLRTHLPKGWEIGDRSGADASRTRSIVAVIWPPKQAPVFVAIYTDHNERTKFDRRNAVIAELGATLFDVLQNTAN